MATTTVDYAGQVLTDVREQIAADDDVLKEARERRNLVTKHARDFDGALKSFNSGSVAHGTVNKPVSDADAGIVLDRRKYPELGPDGDDEPPNAIVEDVAFAPLRFGRKRSSERATARAPDNTLRCTGRVIPNLSRSVARVRRGLLPQRR
jgi:hypothetical protein